jgi:hypothetical protein
VITASIYIVDGSVFFSIFYATKCWCVLLTLKNKLHLFSTENAVVKNKGENSKRNSLAAFERTKKRLTTYFAVLFFFLTFSCLSLRRYFSVNIWVQPCRQINTERTARFILLFFLFPPCIILLFKHHRLL